METILIEPKVYSVSRINRYIKSLIDDDFILKDLFISGEISNLALKNSNMYFTLKDNNAAINCVMFKGGIMELLFEPENGMSVVAYGYVSIYEKTGQYQFYAQFIEPKGIGALTLAFEQLKLKLYNEGLFDDDFKRDINKYPNCVAVITSPSGAAVRDIINVITRRNKSVKIVVAPTLVQGEKAPADIVSAIKLVNEWGGADTIILGRGGGSVEDLWAFNEEIVARAIFASETPVISAVGHEIDFTIADFVADLRAPTPSAAAELAVSNFSDTFQNINSLEQRLDIAIENILNNNKTRLNNVLSRTVMTRPEESINSSINYLHSLDESIEKNFCFIINSKKQSLSNAVAELSALSPLDVLKRGYAVVYSEGKAVYDCKNLKSGDILNIKFNSGEINAKVL